MKRTHARPSNLAPWRSGRIGDALALPYGPTPVSRGDECHLASPVVQHPGRLDTDARILATVRDGDPVRVEPVGDRG
nr:cyclophilin-like family protein [Streptomyces sp. NK08204]